MRISDWSSDVALPIFMLLDGEHEVNEVFFTDVRVPIENLVGEENSGWTYAKYLLTLERTSIAGFGLALAALRWLQHIAHAKRSCGKPLAENPLFASRMAKHGIDLENMTTTKLGRTLCREREWKY